MITASDIISKETLPTDPTTLWELAVMSLVDWSSGIEVRTSWMTDVLSAKSLSEQRRGLLSRPVHGISLSLQSVDKASTARLLSIIRRRSLSRSLVPLFSDLTLLLATATSSTTLSCDTTFRRFVVGGRIAVIPRGDAISTEDVQITTISEIADDTLTVQDAITASVGDLILPLIEARASLQDTLTVISDEVSTCQMESVESPGKWALDALATPGTTPSGFGVYGGIPILDIPPNYRDSQTIEQRRSGSFSKAGIGDVPVLYGDRGLVAARLNFTSTSREDAWKLLTFFDSRAGRLYPFWFCSPLGEYEFVGWTGGGALELTANGPVIDWQLRPYIFIKTRSGATYIRTVISVVRDAGIDTVTLDSTPAGSPTDVSRCGLAIKARFDVDELVEQWSTDQVMETSFSLIEVLEEKAITISNLNDPTLTGFSTGFAAGGCSTSPMTSEDILSDGPAPCNTCPSSLPTSYLVTAPDRWNRSINPITVNGNCAILPLWGWSGADGIQCWEALLALDGEGCRWALAVTVIAQGCGEIPPEYAGDIQTTWYKTTGDTPEGIYTNEYHPDDVLIVSSVP